MRVSDGLRQNLALLVIAALALTVAACASGSRLRVQQQQVVKQVEDMRSRAYRCSPRELALAETHADFGDWELDQGNLARAEEHLKYAAEFAELADMQSKANECQDVQVVVASDRDGDGYLDEVDGCPDEPEDFDGDRDEDGCPDIELDKDGDRILDNLDRCPLDPEDYDGFEDVEGCPDWDNDKDTICDPWVDQQGKTGQYECAGSDQCPDQPEDFDQFEDEDGCPDLDNDNDKILDVNDKCPLDPEDYDGDADEDGCPEERSNFVIKDDVIEIKQQFFFATNKTKVLPKSEPLLDELAQILKDNDTINIRIEGHTDSDGSDKHNKKLSQGRADSVMTELVARGIDPGRMVAVGWGEERPIDTNETKEGKANNRRVEIHITSK